MDAFERDLNATDWSPGTKNIDINLGFLDFFRTFLQGPL